MKLYFDKLDQKHVSCNHMDVPENSGTPKSSTLIGFFHHKPSILGYPYFWKHPYVKLCSDINETQRIYLKNSHDSAEKPGHLKVVARILSTAPFENFGLWDLYLIGIVTCVYICHNPASNLSAC